MEQAPSGISQPKPVPAVRVRRSIIIIVGVVAALVVGAVAYGLSRQPAAMATAGQGVDLKVGPATESGRLIAAIKPKPLVAQQQTGPLPVIAPAVAPGGIVPVQPQPQYQTPPPQGLPAPTVPAKTGEQLAREAAYEAEQMAVQASPVVTNWGGTATAIQSAPAGAVPVSGTTTGVPLVKPVGQQTDAEHLDSFIAAGKDASKKTYLASTRVPGASLYEVKAGWLIPAILESQLSSELPGEFRALVATDVYDTRSGRYLLIPQGSRLIGTYSSEVQYGQGALAATSSRIIYPDGSSQILEGMEGVDAAGRAGFRDLVNRHYIRLVGSGLLTSLFSAAAAISVNRSNNSTFQYPTATQTASQAVGAQMSQLGIEITRKNLNVAPTITVRPGYRFHVFVNRDLIFEGEYIRAR